MAFSSVRLPRRFPVGTKFVIEGRPGGQGEVYGRYLEFPDGTRLRLPKQPVRAQSASTRRRRAQTRRR